MSYKERIRIRQLLFKMLENSITAEENIELHIWAEAKPSNQNLFDKLRMEGAYENWLNELEQINVPLAWEQFEKNKSKNYRHRFRQKMMSYAAIALIALFSGSFAYYAIVHGVKQPVVIAKSDIKPGVKQAELILSNGQVIKLGQGNGKIKEIDGTYIENNAESVVYNPKEIDSKEEVLMNEIKVKHGQEFKLVLADGTQVWINSMSTIRFPVRFTGNTREVEVLEGEVCFKAAHDSEHPFIVHTPVHSVKVLGTTFNVSCYKEDAFVQTTLLEGKVQINNCIGGLTDVEIKPNQQYVFDKNGLKAEVVNVNASSVLAWTKGYFEFDDESLEQIFNKLQRWYDIDVFFVNNDRRHESFTGNLTRFENIDKILEMIEEVSDVEFETNGKIIKIN